VLAVLMLRGPQTVGEIRTRTGRMASFASMEAVEGVLEALSGREEPLVTALPRRPGQKEARYAHRIGGEPEDRPDDPVPTGEASALEAEVAELRAALDALRAEFEAFRDAFR